jgi:polysaccharide pyruvyl transferase WcaK-like protein
VKVLVIGDVGVKDGVIHLGDEAMLAELLHQLRERDISDITVISANPADTAARYGVNAILPLDFSAERVGTQHERDMRIQSILRASHGEGGMLDWQDPAWQVIEAIMAADAVVIAGGGNLSSIWPAHVYERATIGMLAAYFTKPLGITGQSIGPALLKRDGELVAQLLKSAAIVGVRETSSRDLVAALGVEAEVVRHTIDDATFVSGSAEAQTAPYCIVTFASYTGTPNQDAVVTAAAALLDHIALVTGLNIVMIAHVAAVDGNDLRADAALHARILAAVTASGVTSRSTDDIGLAAALARNAELSVSSRYHPTVFASGAGVPTIGIGVDDYTDSKISGALENFGQLEHFVPISALFTGDAALLVSDVWKRRASIRKAADLVIPKRVEATSQWWDDLVAALRSEPATRYIWQEVAPVSTIDAALRARLDGMRTWLRLTSQGTTGTAIAVRELTETLAGFRHATALAEGIAGAAQSELDAALTRADDAEAALAASHELATALGDPLFEKKLSREPDVPQTTDILMLLDTRLFRWSRVPRRLYGVVRRGLRVWRTLR